MSPRLDVPRFFESMQRALQGVQRRVALGPILPIVPRDVQWEEACYEVNSFFDRYIDLAITESLDLSVQVSDVSRQEETPKKRLSVLSELMDQSKDRLYIRDQLLSVFLPLHNSGPIVISNIFFQVARAPEVFAKLRAEVIEIGDVELTFEILKSLKYLQCVIKESGLLPAGKSATGSRC